jgi:hypothetical protein
MKVLNCKVCQEEVEVPENRLSVICTDCARTQQLKKDLEGAIEKQKAKIEQCSLRISRNKMVETLKMLYILQKWSAPISNELLTFAEAFAREVATEK